MESYDRVMAALERRPMDRAPMRLNARQEVIAELETYLEIDSDDALLRRLGIDFRYVAPRYAGPRPRPGFLPENAPKRPEKQSALSARGIQNNFRVYAPFANMRDAAELDAYEAFLNQDFEYQDPGVDILNPIQVGAVGMAPKGLKRNFGDRLTFCGGIDVQSTLPFGTPEDVRHEVLDRIAVLGKGGGYILDSTNFIQPDTSPENVMAIFDTGREAAIS